jgi:hypothetical protein
MNVIEVKGVGAIVAEQVLVVWPVEVVEPKAGDTATTSFDVTLAGKLLLKVPESSMTRAEFLKRIGGEYVPAAERADTGGVKLASSEMKPGGRR